jgi:hypothetical protein
MAEFQLTEYQRNTVAGHVRRRKQRDEEEADALVKYNEAYLLFMQENLGASQAPYDELFQQCMGRFTKTTSDDEYHFASAKGLKAAKAFLRHVGLPETIAGDWDHTFPTLKGSFLNLHPGSLLGSGSHASSLDRAPAASIPVTTALVDRTSNIENRSQGALRQNQRAMENRSSHRSTPAQTEPGLGIPPSARPDPAMPSSESVYSNGAKPALNGSNHGPIVPRNNSPSTRTTTESARRSSLSLASQNLWYRLAQNARRSPPAEPGLLPFADSDAQWTVVRAGWAQPAPIYFPDLDEPLGGFQNITKAQEGSLSNRASPRLKEKVLSSAANFPNLNPELARSIDAGSFSADLVPGVIIALDRGFHQALLGSFPAPDARMIRNRISDALERGTLAQIERAFRYLLHLLSQLDPNKSDVRAAKAGINADNARALQQQKTDSLKYFGPNATVDPSHPPANADKPRLAVMGNSLGVTEVMTTAPPRYTGTARPAEKRGLQIPRNEREISQRPVGAAAQPSTPQRILLRNPQINSAGKLSSVGPMGGRSSGIREVSFSPLDRPRRASQAFRMLNKYDADCRLGGLDSRPRLSPSGQSPLQSLSGSPSLKKPISSAGKNNSPGRPDNRRALQKSNHGTLDTSASMRSPQGRRNNHGDKIEGRDVTPEWAKRTGKSIPGRITPQKKMTLDLGQTPSVRSSRWPSAVAAENHGEALPQKIQAGNNDPALTQSTSPDAAGSIKSNKSGLGRAQNRNMAAPRLGFFELGRSESGGSPYTPLSSSGPRYMVQSAYARGGDMTIPISVLETLRDLPDTPGENPDRSELLQSRLRKRSMTISSMETISDPTMALPLHEASRSTLSMVEEIIPLPQPVGHASGEDEKIAHASALGGDRIEEAEGASPPAKEPVSHSDESTANGSKPASRQKRTYSKNEATLRTVSPEATGTIILLPNRNRLLTLS